jgi:hypothetical protein
VSLDGGYSSALSGIGSRLKRVAACTLGLMLALCLAGLTGQLSLDTVAAALGFVAAGGLMGARVVVCDALERAGLHGQPLRDHHRGCVRFVPTTPARGDHPCSGDPT